MHAAMEAPAKPAVYEHLVALANSMLAGERDWLPNLCNLSALIFDTLPDLNWAGFYLLRGDALVVGPFQGKPACTRIAMGAGVCGAAAASRSTVVVPDVHAFAGHIACDSASRSEIVVPFLLGPRLLGVLDVDSPMLARFDAVDQSGMESLVSVLIRATDWPDRWA